MKGLIFPRFPTTSGGQTRNRTRRAPRTRRTSRCCSSRATAMPWPSWSCCGHPRATSANARRCAWSAAQTTASELAQRRPKRRASTTEAEVLDVRRGLGYSRFGCCRLRPQTGAKVALGRQRRSANVRQRQSSGFHRRHLCHSAIGRSQHVGSGGDHGVCPRPRSRRTWSRPTSWCPRPMVRLTRRCSIRLGRDRGRPS